MFFTRIYLFVSGLWNLALILDTFLFGEWLIGKEGFLASIADALVVIAAILTLANYFVLIYFAARFANAQNRRGSNWALAAVVLPFAAPIVLAFLKPLHDIEKEFYQLFTETMLKMSEEYISSSKSPDSEKIAHDAVNMASAAMMAKYSLSTQAMVGIVESAFNRFS